MVHHKHKRLAFLSLFFALPGLATMIMLLGVYLWRSGHFRSSMSDAVFFGDPQVYFIMAVAGLAYMILLYPAYILLRKLEHEPHARRARMALLLLAFYNAYLFLLAGTYSLSTAVVGLVFFVGLGFILDKIFPHYL